MNISGKVDKLNTNNVLVVIFCSLLTEELLQ